MAEPDIPLVLPPPPPAPDLVTIDSDDEKVNGEKEDGELSDHGPKTPTNESKKKKNSKKLRRDSDIEVISDSLYVLDDGGADVVYDLDDDAGFQALQQAVGIEETSFDLTLNITETPKDTRSAGTCFNCGGAHTLAECILPRDHKRISRNRNAFSSTKKE